jgi:hypothetical protein
MYKCYNYNCINYADKGLYCKKHTCLREKCFNQIFFNSSDEPTYCDLHICPAKDCKKPGIGDSGSQCGDHKCGYPNCTNNTIDFCKEHICKINGCKKMILEGLSRCGDSHKCAIKDCNENCDSELDYSGCCNKQSIFVSNYCKYHKCVIYLCENLRGNSYLCTAHMTYYTKI